MGWISVTVSVNLVDPSLMLMRPYCVEHEYLSPIAKKLQKGDIGLPFVRQSVYQSVHYRRGILSFMRMQFLKQNFSSECTSFMQMVDF